jgi:uncharacterized DUF497 family protein
MSNIGFVWDPKKNVANKGKHGVSFEEAQTVFYDEYAQLIADPDHSDEEDRFIILGRSSRLRILVVCHCYYEEDEEIRIISARKATKHEQIFYKG